MPKHIGIVACSAEGAALCYRTICVEGEQLMGKHAHPEVSMHTFSLDDYMQPIYRGDWQAVGELMLASAHKLAKTGADFLICPDNTIHQALRYVEPRSPLPWLHIAEVRRGTSCRAWISAPGAHRHALARRQQCLSREARSARLELSAADAGRSAMRSIASSWTSWSAACSSRKASPTFSA